MWSAFALLRLLCCPCYRLHPMEAIEAKAQPVNWEAVRVLAMAIGVREAARRMGISEDAVRKRSSRESWLANPEARKAVQAVTNGRTSEKQVVTTMSPAGLVLAEIASLGGKTRLSIARGVSKAAEHVENMQGSDILDRANDVKAVAQTADLVHGWK